ncbi:ATP-binding cassette domain-containing protein, partial [Candidatus Saccharibacteria bacterium]|nr:ATP-binding cassette domain-containing protein [Candidatus Saccharibacteria bacterium]
MAKSDNIIEVEHFKISFAGKTVIKDLSFSVKRGEIFGLLGSNGSGKTTTIRALLGLYFADKGTLHINGKQFEPGDAVRIGYLPEERGLYKKENVYDVMTYFAHLKGLTNAKTWIMDYLKRVGLEEFAKTKINKLSQGMQQKVQ